MTNATTTADCESGPMGWFRPGNRGDQRRRFALESALDLASSRAHLASAVARWRELLGTVVVTSSSACIGPHEPGDAHFLRELADVLPREGGAILTSWADNLDEAFAAIALERAAR